MKTYAEKNGEKPFDWYDFLERAVNNQVDDEEKDRANDKAYNWVTCACGSQCASLPRSEHGMPVDEVLKDLGADFYGEISMGEYENALWILHKIEKRSAYLLNQMNYDNRH